MDTLMNLFGAAVLAGTPLLLGMLGEILTQKSGHLNLGLEGTMYMGAAMSLAGAYYYEQWVTAAGGAASGFVACLFATGAAFLIGVLASLLYCFLTATLRADQNVTGLVLAIFGTGFGNFFGELMGIGAGGYVTVGAATKAAFANPAFPSLAALPVVGKLLFGYNWMVYLGVAVALAMAWFLNHTRAGLNLRAVGENPATADAAGINVTRYKYLATCIGGMIAGLGGLFYIMDYSNGIWSNNGFGDRGWLAIAIVIFATWKPTMAILGSYLFGALYILFNYLNVPMRLLPLIQMLPYLVTIIVLVAVSIRKKRENQPPASLGLSYFREER